MSKVSDMRLDLQDTEEYREGWQAVGVGLSCSGGPYPIGSKERTNWIFGWDDARDEERRP